MDKVVTIGLRAKTGRAIAVVFGGTADSPQVLIKTEIKLVDPKIPATFQPYHAVMELPWNESQKAVRKYARAIQAAAAKAFAKLIKEIQAGGLAVRGVGIVGAKDRDLSRIGNYHIRAHAAEGVLFRSVLNQAAESNGLGWRLFPEKEIDQIGKRELGARYAALKKEVSTLGRALPPPWRSDEKLAAIAAWLVMEQDRER